MICGNDFREQQMYNYKRYSDGEKLVLNDTVLIKDDVLHLAINGRKV